MYGAAAECDDEEENPIFPPGLYPNMSAQNMSDFQNYPPGSGYAAQNANAAFMNSMQAQVCPQMPNQPQPPQQPCMPPCPAYQPPEPPQNSCCPQQSQPGCGCGAEGGALVGFQAVKLIRKICRPCGRKTTTMCSLCKPDGCGGGCSCGKPCSMKPCMIQRYQKPKRCCCAQLFGQPCPCRPKPPKCPCQCRKRMLLCSGQDASDPCGQPVLMLREVVCPDSECQCQSAGAGCQAQNPCQQQQGFQRPSPCCKSTSPCVEAKTGTECAVGCQCENQCSNNNATTQYENNMWGGNPWGGYGGYGMDPSGYGGCPGANGGMDMYGGMGGMGGANYGYGTGYVMDPSQAYGGMANAYSPYGGGVDPAGSGCGAPPPCPCDQDAVNLELLKMECRKRILQEECQKCLMDSFTDPKPSDAETNKGGKNASVNTKEDGGGKKGKGSKKSGKKKKK